VINLSLVQQKQQLNYVPLEHFKADNSSSESHNDDSDFRLLELPGGLYYGQLNFHGQMSGKGIKVLLNGSIFEGSFESDKLVGYGRAIFYDGSMYIGQWGTNGLPHGQGSYTTEDGQLLGTQWYNYINVDLHRQH